MKTLYIECKMGAAGDMIMAALYELLSTQQQTLFLEKMNQLMPDIVSVSANKEKKCGISGTHMHIQINGTKESAHQHMQESSNNILHSHNHLHPHIHHSYSSILEQIQALPVSEEVSKHARAIYQLIGEAEAKVHNTTLEQIHFHEVGTLDALFDVIGCSLIIEMLGIKEILASPIHVGNGTVHCAHGILPVPAPATAELLKGIPFYTGNIHSELCTPTGAAILKHFVTRFTDMPPMITNQIGIGLGTKDFEIANCIRIFLGTMADEMSDTMIDLSCNLDDMTGEDLGYCMELLLKEGALDVFYQPIQMKKNRPGILLHCFCAPSQKEHFLQLLFLHTTTRGVRYEQLSRAKLASTFEEIETPYGIVHNKISTGYGITKSKLEYEDIKKIAREHQMSLAKVRSQI